MMDCPDINSSAHGWVNSPLDMSFPTASDRNKLTSASHADQAGIVNDDGFSDASYGCQLPAKVDKRPRRKAPTLRANDWEPVKARIIGLYNVQKQPLKQVMTTIEREFGFQATERQYRTRISQWSMPKKIRGKEMAFIAQKQHHRAVFETNKRQLKFTLRGQVVPQAKIDRWVRRGNNTHAPSSCTSTTVVPDSTACTPAALSYTTVSTPYGPGGSPATTSDTNTLLSARSLTSDSHMALQVLRSAGFDVNNRQDCDLGRALEWAIDNKQRSAIRLLVEGNAITRSLDCDIRLLMVKSAMESRPDTLQLLMEAGVDPDCCTDTTNYNHPLTPLESAAMTGSATSVRYLLDHGCTVTKGIISCAVLSAGITNGSTTIAGWLLEAGASLEEEDDDEWGSPLCQAADFGHLGLVGLFLDHGADDDGEAFHTAIMRNHSHVVEWFVERGTDVNKRYCDETPLFTAAVFKAVEVASYLIDNGADLKVDGLLHSAFVEVDLKAKAGASVKKRKDGERRYLGEHGPPEAIIRHILVNDKSQLESVNNYGETVLHLAAALGMSGVAQLVLDAGADIHAAEDNGRTPLHLAAENGHLGLVELLLDRGAYCNARDVISETPLSLAAKYGHIAVVQALLGRGATDNLHGAGCYDDGPLADIDYLQ